VSNLGSFGIEGFTPIINLPQVAILGVGAARRVAGVDESGGIGAVYEMVLSLTFDHAFVDGAPAAAFLQRLRETLER
jgi:pyruvate dehydrogenase E2 component (dihydrolipoamide acetyltransferase)